MSLLKSLCMAFSMYSKIPVPKVAWEENNRKYVLCFLPLIGLVEGAAMYLLWMLRAQIGVYIPFPVFVLTGCVLPVLITGGIHLDGFLDTMDALHSWQEKEKKLEILKDPHVGAFACISLACYFCLYGAGLYLLLDERQLLFLMLGFCFSRSLSGLALVTVKSAKKEGLLYTFASDAHKNAVRCVLGLWLVLLFAASGLRYGMWGVGAAAVGLLFFFYYIYMACDKFGGLTGDLAGWFVTVYELIFVWMTGSIGFLWNWW